MSKPANGSVVDSQTMTTFTVTRVRKVLSPDRSHRHLEGVWTTANIHYTPGEVIERMDWGSKWLARAGDRETPIQKLDRCPHQECPTTPYLAASFGTLAGLSLEDLEEC